MKLKRLISLTLVLSMILAFAGCTKSEKTTAKVTMYVGLGNTNSGYYTKFAKALKEETGIEIEYIYYNTKDTSNSVLDRIKNNDLPADIIITASRTPEEYQENAFLDLSTTTNIPDLFTSTFLDSNDIDGSIYQIPFSTRLIGIEYNKTLFEELGWDLPQNFADMVALKEKADAAGIKFAVAGGAATGHGFNYLFHLMGTEYLVGTKGNEWFSKFQKGTETIDAFKSASSYFKEYAEAGLYGELDTENWNAYTEFEETRALFYYNIVNDVYSYDGFQYTDDGELVAETGETITIEKSETGNAVLLNNKYVLYDSTNEAHKGLERYEITGAKVLHDKYASMPWLSKDGNCNCYTTYNNMYVALNKSLGEDGNEEKLEIATKVLEFMASDTAIEIYTELYPDGYVGTKNFGIDASRLYYDYRVSIKSGNIQDWWYNYFDVDSIMSVGQLVNDYLCNKPGVTFDSIMEMLDKRNTENLNKEVDISCVATETLDFADVAKLECIANGMTTQKALDDAGLDIEVTVSILPYTESIETLPIEKTIPVVQAKMYKGNIETSLINSYVTPLTNDPIVIKMTGAEINKIVSAGYNTKEAYDYDHTYAYACVVKGGAKLVDTNEYYVAVPSSMLNNERIVALDSDTYNGFVKGNRIVTDGTNPISGTMVDGLKLYFASVDSVAKDSLSW